jgi:cell division transport system permease protein
MMFQKGKYFLRESLHNLWQFKTRHFFSLTIIALSFVILGVFLTMSNNLRFRARDLSKNLTVIFYLHKNVPPAERDLIEDQIRRSPLVGSVRAVGPEEAAAKFTTDFPDLEEILRNINANPFPASIEAWLKDPALPTDQILQLIAEVKKNAGIEDVQFNREWADKIRSLGRLAEAVGLFLGGILVLASFFIVSNVIKLNVLARRNEIEILRLVGATNTFIRLPFLIEGVLLGILGSGLSLGLLYLLVKLFPLYLGQSLGVLQEMINFRYLSLSQATSLLAGSGFMGLLGSLSSLSRFLKI